MIGGYTDKKGKFHPIDSRTGSNKRKHQQGVQKGDAAYKRSLNADLKDEADDEKAYRKQAEKAPTKSAKKTLTSIADDEKEHQVRDRKLLEKAEKK